MRASLVASAFLALSAPAFATTYEVGPGTPYPSIEAVDDGLNPGDVVVVRPGAYGGDVVLERDGAPGNPITIRGAAGERPRLAGGTNTLEVAGDHHVVEHLDLSGGSARCFYHHAHDVVLRDVVIHDCPNHGILGADEDSGSLLAERVEVARTGEGDRHHSIYMATDEDTHPGAVFTLRHSIVHSATGGNAIKSRAERNVIAYNRIAAGPYHALELIGPDAAGGTAEGLKREDSDVVGNVLVGGPFGALIRVGGDATGQSHGRYRFAFNTMLASGSTSVIFRAFDALDSIEAHGNVIAGGAGSGTLIREAEADWETSPRGVGGDRNWVRDGWAVPPEWTGTLRGADPGFEPGGERPAAGSPLLDAGPAATASPPGHDFPGPLFPPAAHPPAAMALGPVEGRAAGGALDIGAFERGAPGGPPGGGPAAGGGPVPPTSSPALTRSAISQRGRVRVRRRGGRLLVETGQTIRCPAGLAAACTVTVTLRGRRPSAVLGRRAFVVRAGRAVAVRLSLSRRVAARLRRARRLPAVSRVVVRSGGLRAVSAERALVLRVLR